MKVYLAGSISGGRRYVNELNDIARSLTDLGHIILTPFVLNEEVNNSRFPGLTGQERARAIFDEDVGLLEIAEAVVAEVSQTSTGVGMELGILIGMARYGGTPKPTLLLRHDSLRDTRNSYLLEGDPYATFSYYNSKTVKSVLKEYLATREVEGRIRRER